MAITVLPPSPSGEITHAEVRAKINEVITNLNTLGGYAQAIGSAAITDASLYNYTTLTIVGATALSFINIPAGLYTCSFKLIDGGVNVTFPASIIWQGGVAPTLSVTGTDLIILSTEDGGTNWVGSYNIGYA